MKDMILALLKMPFVRKALIAILAAASFAFGAAQLGMSPNELKEAICGAPAGEEQ